MLQKAFIGFYYIIETHILMQYILYLSYSLYVQNNQRNIENYRLNSQLLPNKTARYNDSIIKFINILFLIMITNKYIHTLHMACLLMLCIMLY